MHRRHWIIGAVSVVVLLALGVGIYWSLNNPEVAGAKLRSELQTTQDRIARLQSAFSQPGESQETANAPIIQPGTRVLDVVGTDGRETRITVKTEISHPADDALALGKQAVDDFKTVNDRLVSIEKKLDNPAPVAASAAQTTVADEAAPAPQAAASVPGMNQAEANFFVPHGFHLDRGMGNTANLSKIRGCQPPRHIEIDRASPQCHAAGYLDPVSHMPVRRCPNKCV